MRDFLNGSVLVNALNKAAAWIDRQWNKSVAAALFLKRAGSEQASKNSVFAKVSAVFRKTLNAIFTALRLDKLFEGSIFKRLSLWCCLAAGFAPILPTMAVLGLVLIAFASFFINVGCHKDFKGEYAPVNVFVCLFALIYLVCSVTSVTPNDSIQGGVLTAAFVLFALVLVSGIKTEKEETALIYSLVAAGLVVAAYGILQRIIGVEGDSAWVDEERFDSITTRVYSTLENPNVLAEYLLLVIPLGVSVIVTDKNKWIKLLALGATGAMLLCMLLTSSRGGWLGLVAAAALFLVIMDRRLIVVGLVAACALVFVLPDSVMERFTSIGDLTDSSTSYRVSIWLATVAMLKDYWFCGIGTGIPAFMAVYPAYSFNAVNAPHSHNLFLQIMCECGIVGIVVLLGVIFIYFRTAARGIAESKDSTQKVRLTALIAGMFGFLVQSLTDHSFYNYRVMLMFWVFVALAMIVARSRSEKKI